MSAPLPSLHAAMIVQLDLPQGSVDEGLSGLRTLSHQLPDPAVLASGTLVAIPDHIPLTKKATFWERVTGRAPHPVRVHRAVRCTALLARGYVRVGGAKDAEGRDWAWGYVP